VVSGTITVANNEFEEEINGVRQGIFDAARTGRDACPTFKQNEGQVFNLPLQTKY